MRENAYSKMIILLIGNKNDLKMEREVSTEDGQAFANKHNLIFFETSAKTSNNVEHAFVQSAVVINENIKQGNYDLRTENIGIKPGNTFKSSAGEAGKLQPNNLLRNNVEKQKSGGCCSWTNNQRRKRKSNESSSK